MKKFNIFAAAMVGMLACATSVNAQNEANLNDYRYQMLKFEKSYYTDHVVYNVGDDPHEYTAGSLAKHGAYIGATLGGQYFDKNFAPMGGIVVGWEGGPRTPLKFEYNGTFTVGYYTREADRDNKYCSFDSRLIGAVCLSTSSNKQWRWWAGGYFSYKLSFDYHEETSVNNTHVAETDTKIITTTEGSKSSYEFKASSMGAGGYLEVAYTPFMSKWSYRAYAGCGVQQRFYSDGMKFSPEAFGGIKVVYNFSVAELWDKAFLQKTGLSKKQARQMAKDRARTTVKNY